MKAEKVVVFAGEMNIKSLPSGTYVLVLEARDRENKVLAVRKSLVQRSNPGVEPVVDINPLEQDAENFFR